MSINLSTIRPGGRVSVTLDDGTKIIDSPVNERGHSLFIALNSFRVCDVPQPRVLRNGIASIDAYTPPTPEWDRPEVFAVTDATGDEWVHDHATGKWHLSPGGITGRTASALEDRWGPCTVLAVYAEGVAK